MHDDIDGVVLKTPNAPRTAGCVGQGRKSNENDRKTVSRFTFPRLSPDQPWNQGQETAPAPAIRVSGSRLMLQLLLCSCSDARRQRPAASGVARV